MFMKSEFVLNKMPTKKEKEFGNRISWLFFSDNNGYNDSFIMIL